MADISIGERLESLEWLSQNFEVQQPDLEQIASEEHKAKQLYERHMVTPTIGCEVEIKWSSLFPELAEQFFGKVDQYGRYPGSYRNLTAEQRELFDRIYQETDSIMKSKYEATQYHGIPAGNDSYWEFAQRPTFHWQTLLAETKLLMDAGLIPPGSEHSLHITLGNIEPGNGGVSLILAGLELVGSSEGRMILATEQNRFGNSSTWARRGEDGMRLRYAGFLEFKQTKGTELRTLSVSTSDRLENTLHTAYSLAACLMAFRKRQSSEHPVIRDLGAIWPIYRETIKDLFHVSDLPAESWGNPTKQPKHWLGWAACIGRVEQPYSPEHATVYAIGTIVDEIDKQLRTLQSELFPAA